MKEGMNNYRIYTIGHSTHQYVYFLKLLELYSINCIVDVRSIPYSKYNPQYNKEQLREYLGDNSIYYIYLGDILGARYQTRELLNENGIVDFSKVRKTQKFNQGIKRLIKGIKKEYNISLMCSEKEPIDCHRFVLISYQLKKRGVSVEHILTDGNKIGQEELEQKLLNKYRKRLGQLNLFNNQNNNNSSLLEKAYQLRNQEIGYKVEKEVETV